ncbi:hypothetical protein DFR51_2027 [Sphingosinicella microcystinivorans]|uniref:Uncharacterized protein n=1 Tax=Sphingosinicella microcystinivorans TaxID=335406 RepID=A0ABX9SY87_SPHMI|nr:hypothetical protein DFR51_2027 [Sphingosinicella microcystinivorans]
MFPDTWIRDARVHDRRRAMGRFTNSNINPYIFELIFHLSHTPQTETASLCLRAAQLIRKNTMLRAPCPLCTHPRLSFALKSNFFDY